MEKLEYASIQMENGDIFNGKRIGELVGSVISKFSEEKLTYAEARIVLERANSVLEEFAYIKAENVNNPENSQR
mgnify:CR=1 FL=1